MPFSTLSSLKNRKEAKSFMKPINSPQRNASRSQGSGRPATQSFRTLSSIAEASQDQHDTYHDFSADFPSESDDRSGLYEDGHDKSGEEEPGESSEGEPEESSAEDSELESDREGGKHSLSKPQMEELDEELASDEEEIEDDDGNITVRKGVALTTKDVEKGLKADDEYRKSIKRSNNRYTRIVNRYYKNSKSSEGKMDEELKDIVDWSKEDPRARYYLKPDLNGNYEKIGDGLYRLGKTDTVVKSNGVMLQDGSFPIGAYRAEG